MKIEPVDKIEYKKRSNMKLIAMLEEFVAMNIPYVEVLDWESNYCSVYSCSTTLAHAAMHHGFSHVRASARNGRVYLINTLLANEKD